jgi:4-carboxymuconolactone decarboxylase
MQQLGAAIRFEITLPEDVRELAILLVAAEWRCAYEWDAHLQLAEQAGLDVRSLLPLWGGDDVMFARPTHAIVADASRELFANRTLSPRTFEALDSALGAVHTFELLAVLGYYSSLAIIMNALDVHPT